jgi:hypothetical protein
MRDRSTVTGTGDDSPGQGGSGFHRRRAGSSITGRRGVWRALPLLAMGAVSVGAGIPSTASAQTATSVVVRVLSTRADLVSGGVALVEIDLPAGASITGMTVTLGTTDVSSLFALRSNGKVEGLVTGLALGANTLTAKLASGQGATLTIVNHPIGGPIFSGPQIQPWLCQAGATDHQCDQAPTYSYVYMPVGGAAGFQTYNPKSPPPAATIARTTTTEGVTVPFIVRQETGYIDRDQYAVATLWQPGKAWAPWAPQPQYNGRLVITHGASCDTTYGTGSAPSVQNSKMLGGGFILMSNALDNAGHNCNIATQAESLVMTKEHVIDTYGEVRWTIGSGCSGGSLVQQQVANAFPGLYQGISPQCSFTDAWSSAMEYVDYDMLLRYWKTPTRWDTGDVWTPVQMDAVIDHPNVANPISFTTAIPNGGNPSRSCPDVPAAQVYNAKTNPHGVRCTLQDYTVNVFGRRASDGFANRAFDNTGIQYGLSGLASGLLTTAQFVDLNSNLGGLDVDDNVQPQRTLADLTGLVNAYRSGAVDEASNLNQVAIIDLRGPDEGSFHDVYRTYALRDRLLRNFGTAANQVLWRGQVPLLGDVNYADQAVFALDKWLARVNADSRPLTLPQKIIQDKPGTVTDRCTDGAGTELPHYVCDETVVSYGTPRFAAGEPQADDILKCQLKPLNRADYNVTFTAAQWARLQKAFPSGVCDYSLPGVGQQDTIPWLSYQDSTGAVVYGGTPLGAAPQSVPFGTVVTPVVAVSVPRIAGSSHSTGDAVSALGAASSSARSLAATPVGSRALPPARIAALAALACTLALFALASRRRPRGREHPR